MVERDTQSVCIYGETVFDGAGVDVGVAVVVDVGEVVDVTGRVLVIVGDGSAVGVMISSDR